jgi:uncharacterized protein
VRFWDASALVPLFIRETKSSEVESWRAADPRMTTWMMTRIEVVSAVARRKREQPELAALWERAIREVHEVASRWIEIWDADATRRHAERHGASAARLADALQLGAALVAADGEPQSLELVTLDRRLAEAARREGFPVLGV